MSNADSDLDEDTEGSRFGSGDETMNDDSSDVGECNGHGKARVNDYEVSEDSDSNSEFVRESDDGFESGVGSDCEEEGDPIFSTADTYNPRFILGMRFSNRREFADAVKSYGIMNRRNVGCVKNDTRRVYAQCFTEGCPWRINLLKVPQESTYQIRLFHDKHNCGRSYHVKNVTAPWLAKRYEGTFKSDPTRKTKGFRRDVIKDIKVHVSHQKCYRAKNIALDKINGSCSEQYDKLWDYAAEIRRTNPGSTVIMVTNEVAIGRKFDKFYVCFEALKRGFLSGCRPIIGVDGCHLKGPHGGILLTAVSVDPNNMLYPIAWAVVPSETREAWEWFLNLLKEDLGMVRDDILTFISDKQKGLIPAFQSVFPGAENRFCVRHLHGNFKKAGYKGLSFKQALWKAARASTVAEFDRRMKEMGKLSENVLDWFEDKPASQWSLSHFSFFSKSDMLLNNICESFNSIILEAREESILTMLEWIREYMMARLQENRDRANKKWHGRICPKIKKIMDENFEKSGHCIPLKADDYNYEINCCDDGNRYIVDLLHHKCSCRKWELSGIPCEHAMSAIGSQVLNSEDFVHEYYSVTTYKRVYAHSIKPINGPLLWEKTGFIPPLPPNFGRKPGRPSRARRYEPDEPRINKKKKGTKKLVRLRRKNYKIKCGFCDGEGHNKKGCEVRKWVEYYEAEEHDMERADAENVPGVGQHVPSDAQFNGNEDLGDEGPPLPENIHEVHQIFIEYPSLPEIFPEVTKVSTTVNGKRKTEIKGQKKKKKVIKKTSSTAASERIPQTNVIEIGQGSQHPLRCSQGQHVSSITIDLPIQCHSLSSFAPDAAVKAANEKHKI